MILVRHYCAALFGAVLIHLAGLFLLSCSVPEGAVDRGEQGVDIDLGMLGELGSATETQHSSALTAPPIAAVTASQEEPSAAPIEQNIVQEIAPPAQLKQSAEIRVKQAPVKQIDRASDQPIAQKVAQMQKASLIQETIATAGQGSQEINPQARDAVSSLKMSSGTGNAVSSGGSQAYKQSYYALIAATLARYKRYPNYARDKGQEGTVLLSFIVLRSGLVKEVKIRKSSGYRQLDRAVKKMVKDASPLPPFSAQQSAQEITISIPIVFKLTQ